MSKIKDIELLKEAVVEIKEACLVNNFFLKKLECFKIE